VTHKIESWQNDRIIRLPEVKDITGASETSIWRWEREEEFPKRIKIGARMVGWRKSAVMAWVLARSGCPTPRPNLNPPLRGVYSHQQAWLDQLRGAGRTLADHARLRLNLSQAHQRHRPCSRRIRCH